MSAAGSVLYKNALVYQAGRGFVRGGFCVENGRFVEVYEGEPDADISGDLGRSDALAPDAPAKVDLGGARVIPGLVDIHIHGSAGADFSDGDAEGLERMAGYLASRGVTSFVPTTMTLPYEAIDRAFKSAVSVREAAKSGLSRVAGVRMEGPYLSENKRGSQNPEFIRYPDFDEFKSLFDSCGGLIKIVDVAPELNGAVGFAKRAGEICVVSAAHTDADYDTARTFFEAGASHLTHLFNAMPRFEHREPGVIGAALDDESVTAELISDGIHVHETAVRAAFKLFGKRLCLISDSLSCCGTEDGDFKLGGLEVRLSGGEARLKDGSLAGSAVDLYTCMLRAISFGIPEETAIEAATAVPARVIGAEADIGSIAPGRFADFVVCGEGLDIKRVFVEGRAPLQ